MHVHDFVYVYSKKNNEYIYLSGRVKLGGKLKERTPYIYIICTVNTINYINIVVITRAWTFTLR